LARLERLNGLGSAGSGLQAQPSTSLVAGTMIGWSWFELGLRNIPIRNLGASSRSTLQENLGIDASSIQQGNFKHWMPGPWELESTTHHPPQTCLRVSAFTAMADEIVLPISNLELPQHFFTLSRRYPNTMKMLQNTDVVRLGLFGSSMPMRFTEKTTQLHVIPYVVLRCIYALAFPFQFLTVHTNVHPQKWPPTAL
jgi:hypothetical protein